MEGNGGKKEISKPRLDDKQQPCSVNLIYDNGVAELFVVVTIVDSAGVGAAGDAATKKLAKRFVAWLQLKSSARTRASRRGKAAASWKACFRSSFIAPP